MWAMSGYPRCMHACKQHSDATHESEILGSNISPPMLTHQHIQSCAGTHFRMGQATPSPTASWRPCLQSSAPLPGLTWSAYSPRPGEATCTNCLGQRPPCTASLGAQVSLGCTCWQPEAWGPMLCNVQANKVFLVGQVQGPRGSALDFGLCQLCS